MSSHEKRDARLEARKHAPNKAQPADPAYSGAPPHEVVPPLYSIAAYRFDLPEELIAQYPPADRGGARLMIIEPKSGGHTLTTVSELATMLPPGCLLVGNNTRVFPARLPAIRPGGGKAEFLLLTPLPLITGEPGRREGWEAAPAKGLARPAKRLKPGMVLHIGIGLEVVIQSIGAFGQAEVTLFWRRDLNLSSLVHQYGKLPLPPYIRREPQELDYLRYQTIFSSPGKEEGSVAAPTAGLHITPELLDSLHKNGHDWAEITLHVGYGTFSPVRTEDIRNHVLHREYYSINSKTCVAVNRALSEKRPIIAVGTTSARALEGAARQHGKVHPHNGSTDIFIYPPYRFQVISGLFTNFHLPESTLLMLVSALTGRERLLAAYKAAIAARMRFFSYGDAMLIRPAGSGLP